MSRILSETPPPQWTCLQIGRREHYSIPRSLHAKGQLFRMLTDAWFPEKFWSKVLPSRIYGRLADRFHPQLENARVDAFSINWLIRESMMRKPRITNPWDLTIRRNNWFQDRCVQALSRLTPSTTDPTLFAYSYAALRPFEWAKANGWRTVLGQIDPGPCHEEVVAKATGNPELRELGPPDQYWKNWRRECSLADHIVVNSEWSADCLQKSGIDRRRIEVIPLAYETTYRCDAKSYPQTFSVERPIRLLYAGKMASGKGVRVLIRAMQTLNHSPVSLTLAGPIMDVVPEEWKAIPSITWMGEVTGSNMQLLYDQHDLFVFPTFSDGYGLTQLECQGRRMPLIASKYCGSVVKHMENGWILENVNEPEIASSIRFALENPTVLQQWSKQSDLPMTSSLSSIGERLLRMTDRASP